MPALWLAVAGLTLLVVTPCRGEAVVEVSPSSTIALTGATATVSVDIDLGSETLGSYGGTLVWDPTVLEFVSWAGGDPPFDTPVVNTGNATSGMLSFADAAATGAQGGLTVLEVTFQTAGEPPATTVLDLELSSLFSGDFEDLAPQANVEDGTTCVADFFYDLQLTGSQSTILGWMAIPQAVSYDVIRGDLSELLLDGAAVHLGGVICLEDNSLDTTTGLGTEPPNPDTDVPLVGQGFFYLVRFNDGTGNRTYGFFTDCTLQRIVDAGDCL